MVRPRPVIGLAPDIRRQRLLDRFHEPGFTGVLGGEHLDVLASPTRFAGIISGDVAACKRLLRNYSVHCELRAIDFRIPRLFQMLSTSYSVGERR